MKANIGEYIGKGERRVLVCVGQGWFGRQGSTLRIEKVNEANW